MFTLSNLICDYKDLLEDKSYLESLQSRSDEANGCLEVLLLHNTAYISHVERFLRDHIPESFSDFDKLSYHDAYNWFDVWKKYPHLFSEREEQLICLFSKIADINFRNWEMYQDRIKDICLSDRMVYFAATVLPHKKSVLDALYYVISKCASLNEQEVFDNKVKLQKMEL